MINLKLFFEEKEIPFTVWDIKYNGEIHSIDSDYIIACILSTKGKEREKIASTLSMLDFRNGMILDYLKFLAECLIKERFKNE